MYLKLSSAECRPYCLSLSELVFSSDAGCDVAHPVKFALVAFGVVLHLNQGQRVFKKLP